MTSAASFSPPKNALMEWAELRAWRCEYMRNYRKKQRASETAEKTEARCAKRRTNRQRLKELETDEEAKQRRAKRSLENRATYERRKQRETDEEAQRRRVKKQQYNLNYREKRRRLKADAHQHQQERRKTTAKIEPGSAGESPSSTATRQRDEDDDILGQVVSSDFQEDNERFTLMGFKGEAALSSDDHASLSDTFSLYGTDSESSSQFSQSDLFLNGVAQSKSNIKSEPEGHSSHSDDTRPNSGDNQPVRKRAAMEGAASPGPEPVAMPVASSLLGENFIEQPLTESEVLARMQVVSQELVSLQKKQHELEIVALKSETLRQRFLDNLLREQNDKQQEYEDLANILHQYK